MNLQTGSNFRPMGRAAVLAGLAFAGTVVAQIRPETISSGLENPWGVAFLSDGRFAVTERAGRLRVIAADGKISPPVTGLPAIAAGGQGGLLDVLADSGFEKNRTLYFCFSEPQAGGSANGTALARAQLSEDGAKLENLRIIFSQQPKVASRNHFGCRIVEARDGTLFLTLGDRYSRKEDAQKLDSHIGKVVRIAKDGTVPKDNPFVGRAGALPEIWSYGHRNGQGAALAPDGRFWMTEHGPQGGDEINVPQAGRNYGWPVITYGENYGGGKIGDGVHLAQGLGRRRVVGLSLRDLALERVVSRGCRVGLEPFGADQDDGSRGLGTHVAQSSSRGLPVSNPVRTRRTRLRRRRSAGPGRSVRRPPAARRGTPPRPPRPCRART